MLKIFFSLITGDVTPEQWKFLSRIAWRGLVAFHMAYACGYLMLIGIPLGGFAQAQQIDEVRQDVAKLKEAGSLQARLGIVREIRIQTATMCQTADLGRRLDILSTIDRLREDYFTITKQVYAEVRCP